MPLFKDFFLKGPRDTLIFIDDDIYAHIKLITDPLVATKYLDKDPITLQTVLR
jgi:hypothetical protein